MSTGLPAAAEPAASGVRWRSVLFAPANNPALVAKLPRSNPDVVVLDLEDAVPGDRKVEARAQLAAAIGALRAERHGPLVAVRVNAVATPHFAADVAEATAAGAQAIVVPKLDRAVDAAEVRATLHRAAATAEHPAEPLLVAGLETALGVLDARTFLADGFAACYFGAEDFAADMGGMRTDHNAEVQAARAMVAMAARVCGVVALDIVTADIRDHDRFRREAAEARALGYRGKLCIHPGQVALARESFVPDAAEVARAQAVLQAWDDANARGVGAIAFEGQLVDEPMATRARAVLAAAE